jgi:hypothetical protein
MYYYITDQEVSRVPVKDFPLYLGGAYQSTEFRNIIGGFKHKE